MYKFQQTLKGLSVKHKSLDNKKGSLAKTPSHSLLQTIAKNPNQTPL